MKHHRYLVLDPAARIVAGAPVSADRMVDLTVRAARYPLDQGLIAPAPLESAPLETPLESPVDPPRHPLDHDGDGRPGGSLPGPRRRRTAPGAGLDAEG